MSCQDKPLEQLFWELEGVENSLQLQDQLKNIRLLSNFFRVSSFKEQSKGNSRASNLEAEEVTLSGIKTMALDAVEANDQDMFIVSLILNLQHTFHKTPRDTQLLALLLFIHSQEGLGRLLQISTGEGKSIIIALLAAYQSLFMRKKVDITTSGDVLARRDAEHFREFYENLGLTVSHNIDFYVSFLMNSNQENAYECDILYGTAHHFEGDILRDFLHNKTIADRRKDCNIADEVDSMLVDGNRNVTKLSSHSSGFDTLQPVRLHIWKQLTSLLLSNNGRAASFPFKLQPVLEKQITECIESNIFHLNKYYKKLALMLVKVWVEKALMAALDVEENVDYIIKNGEIKIQDRATGETRSKSRWQHGLHQFLELKHNLPLHNEEFTSVYYSHHRFYSEYSKLFGLTGTVGLLPTRSFLCDVYKVDILIVPTFRPKKFEELPPIVCQESEWSDAVICHILDAFRSGRPVLAILESIHEVNRLHECLKVKNRELNHHGQRTMRIVEYFDSEQENLSDYLENIDTSTVILATNLAGRGTDIDTNDEIDANGGLFVIFGFLATKRIVDQGLGRTSRQGRPGSAIIIAAHELGWVPEIHKALVESINENEKVFLEGDARKLIASLALKDSFFKTVCQFITDGPYGDLRKDPARLEGVIEQWGVFFCGLELQDDSLSLQEQESMFREFMSDLSRSFQAGNYSPNDRHYLIAADHLLQSAGNGNAAQIQLQKAAEHGEGETAGSLLRQAMIMANAKNYAGAKKKVNDALEKHKEQLARKLVQKEITKSAMVVNEAVNIVNEPVTEPHLDDLQFALILSTGTPKPLQAPNLSPVSGPSRAVPAEVVAEVVPDYEAIAREGAEIAAEVFEAPAPDIRAPVAPMAAPVAAPLEERVVLNDPISVRLDQVETNATLQEMERSIDQWNADFESAAQTIMNGIAQGEQATDGSTIEIVSKKNSQKGEYPVPEVVRKPPKKKKKRGILGYIMGAFSIIVGGCLTFFSAGLLASFGIGMVMNGIDLIKLNYDMNKNGTYNNACIIKKTLADTAIAFCAAGLTNLESLRAMLPAGCEKLISGVSAIAESASSYQASKMVVTQALAKYLSYRELGAQEPGRFGELLQDEAHQVHGNFSSAPSSEPMTKEQEAARQLQANQAVQEWYDTQLSEQLNAIHPDRIEAFYQQMDVVVNRLLGELKGVISRADTFNILWYTLVVTSKQQDYDRCLGKAGQLLNSMLRKGTVRVTVCKVIAFHDWTQLQRMRIDHETREKFGKALTELQNSVSKCNPLGQAIFDRCNAKSDRNLVDQAALEARVNALNAERTAYESRGVGNPATINANATRLERDINSFNQNIETHGTLLRQAKAMEKDLLKVNAQVLDHIAKQGMGSLSEPFVKSIFTRLGIGITPVVTQCIRWIVEEASDRNSTLNRAASRIPEVQKDLLEAARGALEQSVLSLIQEFLHQGQGQ